MRLGILIPTRNRPDIARRALTSALDAAIADVVLVSDNSTDDVSRRELAGSVGELRAGARILSPPEPLSMSMHWQWAMSRLLDEHPELTHVTVLTDRMVYQTAAPGALRRVVEETPGKIVSWGHDTVDDYDRPIRLYQEPWSGRRLVIPTGWVANVARGGLLEFAPLPRLLNCIAPVGILQRVNDRFGTMFESVAPDFCFAYRAIATIEDFVYYDRSCVIQSHLHRSNGTNVARRGSSDDARDFRDNVTSETLSPDAPIDGIESLYNAIVNEYCFVRAEAPGRLPAIDTNAYTERLALDVARKPDAAERAHDEQLLRAAGWTGTLDPPPPPSLMERIRLDRSCVGAYQIGTAKGLAHAVLGHPLMRPAWSVLTRLGVRPYLAQRFRFRDTETALAYGLAHPRPPWHDHPHITSLAGHPELPPAML